VLAEARARDLVGQVEQHHDEQIEDQDRARVDDDLHRRQKLRAQQQEDARDVQEQDQHPQHAVDRIPARDREEGARHADDRHVIESDLCGEGVHGFLPGIVRSGAGSVQSDRAGVGAFIARL